MNFCHLRFIDQYVFVVGPQSDAIGKAELVDTNPGLTALRVMTEQAAAKAGFDQVQAPFALPETLLRIGEPDYAIVGDIQIIHEYHSPAIDRVGQNFNFRGR